MNFSDKDVWDVIDGNVTNTQRKSFFAACKSDSKLAELYTHLFSMHKKLGSFFDIASTNVNASKPSITSIRGVDPSLN